MKLSKLKKKKTSLDKTAHQHVKIQQFNYLFSHLRK